MAKLFILISAINGALAVGLGAFGAHGLESFLEKTNRVNTFDTAVKYHFYHTLALLAVGLLLHFQEHKLFIWSGHLFITGIIIFCGSLYLLCFLNQPKLGAITPIDGLALIAGWVLLALGSCKL